MDIKALVKRMSLEEKAGQMLQLPPHNFVSDSSIKVSGYTYDLDLSEKQIFQAGSVLGIGNAEEMIQVQKNYLEKSQHKIPLLFMADVIHGYETIFPIPLALSCSWNLETAFKTARISAIEASTSGIHVTFAPMADLSREPRWGRVMEGFGEDPYLLSEFVKMMVKGYQQDDISKKGNIVSCVKHFAGYGAPIGGLDYNTVDMSRLSFYQDYLPAYEAALDAGAKMVMASFNTFEGIPSTVNTFLMVEVLRKQLGFSGVTITDYDGLNQVIAHRVAHNQKESANQGIDAKIDIEMYSSCYVKNIKELVEESLVDEKDIDEAVERILMLKKELGLFDNPYSYASKVDENNIVKSEEHLNVAKEVALECAVLLKNNDKVLPLNKKIEIALVGPYATSTSTNGAWSWHGDIKDNDSLLSALKKQNIDVKYVNDKSPHLVNIDVFNNVDLVICALGEDSNESGEAKSKVSLELPISQTNWIKLAKKANKKVVTILYNGRPLVLNNIDDSDAIFEAWFLGTKANEAIVELLLGTKNPSGKLTMSFPRHEGQVPIYYNHLTTGRPYIENSDNQYTSFYIDCEITPKYQFGFGLSYSDFVYKDIKLNKCEITKGDIIEASIILENTSNIAGYEVVQLYIQDEVAKIARPEKELKRFKKIWMEPHSKKRVIFELTLEDLTYKNINGETKCEFGRFLIMIGPDSHKVYKKCLTYRKEDNYDFK